MPAPNSTTAVPSLRKALPQLPWPERLPTTNRSLGKMLKSAKYVPFLRLPPEIRVLVYAYVWTVSNCPQYSKLFGIKSATRCWLGPLRNAWVVYPSTIMRLDPRIKAEFAQELCREFSLQYQLTYAFSPNSQRDVWRPSIPTPAPLFMWALRRCHIELQLCKLGGSRSFSHFNEHEMVRLSSGIKDIADGLRAATQLRELSFTARVCHSEHAARLWAAFTGLGMTAKRVRHVKVLLVVHTWETRVLEWVDGEENERDGRGDYQRFCAEKTLQMRHDAETCESAHCVAARNEACATLDAAFARVTKRYNRSNRSRPLPAAQPYGTVNPPSLKWLALAVFSFVVVAIAVLLARVL